MSDRGPAPPELVEHYFRHEYGRLVAVLVGRVGYSQLERAEDAVQSALEAALRVWVQSGVPEDPSAWLYRVAHNHLLGALRTEAGRARILSEVSLEPEPADAGASAATFTGEVRDEFLRMLFVSCDDRIPKESRLVLALKTLCGFGVGEIAFRLFTSEANIYKRLERARERLREMPLETETPPLEALKSRLPSVHSVLYLLFNEGYLSTHEDEAIRAELCEEAIRLATSLSAHPVGATPETFSLLALMHLHSARLSARRDATGGLLLLEEQDRSLWDAAHLQRGAECLARAAAGEALTRYHVEAGIAAEHCFSPSFASTRWGEIAELYAILERIDPSPLHTLNRAVAIAERDGAAAGLGALQGMTPPTWLEGHYLWSAVLADLHHRAGDRAAADAYRAAALSAAPSQALRRLIERRLSRLSG
ncbi:MAG: sigma-70 family RNA polymerase sigma factor [Myxococcota bacterium]